MVQQIDYLHNKKREMFHLVQFVLSWSGIMSNYLFCTSYFPIYFLLWSLCKHIPVPYSIVRAYQKWGKRNVTVSYVEEPTPPIEPEIILMVPHGSFCIEAGVVMSDFLSRFPDLKVTWMIDITAYFAIPSTIVIPRCYGICKLEYLKHNNIQKCMKNLETLIVLPGGFVEGV